MELGNAGGRLFFPAVFWHANCNGEQVNFQEQKMFIQGFNNLASTYGSVVKSPIQRQTSTTSTANLAERVSISQAAQELATESAEGGETYDFSNMSPQQLLQTMNDLIKAGKMTVDETSSLIGLIPTAISKVQYDGEVPAAYYEPTNFFAKLQQAMAYDEYSHNEQGVIYDRKALAALERFQGTKI